MDPRTKRHLWRIISEEVKGKCAVVLTSHRLENDQTPKHLPECIYIDPPMVEKVQRDTWQIYYIIIHYFEYNAYC